MRGEASEQVMELGYAGAAHHVGGERNEGFAAEDVLDECRQVAAWTGLHEEADALGVEVLDKLGEAHRLGPVPDSEAS